MAYEGYLIKIGDYILPYEYMRANSYVTTYNSQDLDSYRDMEGVLHRTTLKHKVNKAEFETPALMTDKEMAELLNNIKRNYINENERKVHAKVYVPELNEYIEQDAYIPDPKFSIYGIFDDVIKYNPVRFAVIGY